MSGAPPHARQCPLFFEAVDGVFLPVEKKKSNTRSCEWGYRNWLRPFRMACFLFPLFHRFLLFGSLGLCCSQPHLIHWITHGPIGVHAFLIWFDCIFLSCLAVDLLFFIHFVLFFRQILRFFGRNEWNDSFFFKSEIISNEGWMLSVCGSRHVVTLTNH